MVVQGNEIRVYVRSIELLVQHDTETPLQCVYVHQLCVYSIEETLRHTVVLCHQVGDRVN